MTNEDTQFLEFAKMPRLSREVIITEKIDGTNAQILITESGQMFVGSRTRWITPENDNFGFAKWCEANRAELMKLGTGRHYGEWWGNGIQRHYGMKDKRLSLFNVSRFCLDGETPERIETNNPMDEPKMQSVLPSCVGLVPVIARGVFTTDLVERALQKLRDHGSVASPGFANPEGVVVFHIAGGLGFKKTLEKDEVPKSMNGKTK